MATEAEYRAERLRRVQCRWATVTLKVNGMTLLCTSPLMLCDALGIGPREGDFVSLEVNDGREVRCYSATVRYPRCDGSVSVTEASE